jgi:hypothetical protein
MELDPSLGGQMQKQVACNAELLEVGLGLGRIVALYCRSSASY